MRAGRTLLTAFTRHTGTFHKGLTTPKGWSAFVKMCRSEISLSELVARPSARVSLALLNRLWTTRRRYSAPDVIAASTSCLRAANSAACSRSRRSAVSSSSRISASRSLSAASITPRST